MEKPKGVSEDYSPLEQEEFKRMGYFRTHGTAYVAEHATRPSTIGHVLSTSPVALLAWYPPSFPKSPMANNATHRIGEKFLTWTDEDPSLDTMLEVISLWYLTETMPRSIYPYRQVTFHFLPSFIPPGSFSKDFQRSHRPWV